jgi:hypothetical protein
MTARLNTLTDGHRMGIRPTLMIPRARRTPTEANPAAGTRIRVCTAPG